MALRIEDYALIGDCKTAALVGRDGSIDWLCWPRFDSAACFAALLGTADNGRWLIAPKDLLVGASRRYRPGTLVLETEFQTEAGSAAVIDFMPPADGADLVRIVVGRSGRVIFQTELVARFNYGAAVPWVSRLDDGSINAIAGPERLLLRTPVALYGEDLRTVGEFAVEAGQSIPFVLSYGASFQSPPPAIDGIDALARTEAFWRQWSDRCPDVKPWTEAVKRSLITLKALTYAPTGGIVAAATTSLPERLGGVRNWDYRYCWLRDATFTLLAFMNLGYYDEAQAWRDWLIRAVAGSPDQAQIMYGVGGERWLPELTVPWLPGYENSAPVRIENELEAQAFHDSGHRWREIADEIHAEVCERGFDRDLDSFVQAYGSKRLDASLLLLPMVGFLPPEDPRVRGTLPAIEERLLINGEFVLRYETESSEDGLPAGEGAFLACSFWLVGNYILQGRDAEARKLFARLLARCNDVGLLAEEFDPLAGRMLGNFPQAYSHVGLINCALSLSRQKGPAEERAESQGPPITVASTAE